MSDTSLEVFDRSRAFLRGIELPAPPPTRIYISGQQYRIVAPTVALPPVVNVVKAILNWIGPAGRIAKNILHFQGAPPAPTSDPTFLKNLADIVMNAAGSSALAGSFSSLWTLQSVTCKDLAGTSAQASSTVAAYPGGVTGGSLPPQSALCISWQIAESYRGGKPRTYVPGVPFTATTPAGSSTLDPTFCTNADTAWTSFMNYFPTHPVSATYNMTLGCVSYYQGHTLRPTPLFRAYLAVKVHERLDSQRRRSGPESAFPVTP